MHENTKIEKKKNAMCVAGLFKMNHLHYLLLSQRQILYEGSLAERERERERMPEALRPTKYQWGLQLIFFKPKLCSNGFDVCNQITSALFLLT